MTSRSLEDESFLGVHELGELLAGTTGWRTRQPVVPAEYA
jgi:hypothetical protein